MMPLRSGLPLVGSVASKEPPCPRVVAAQFVAELCNHSLLVCIIADSAGGRYALTQYIVPSTKPPIWASLALSLRCRGCLDVSCARPYTGQRSWLKEPSSLSWL